MTKVRHTYDLHDGMVLEKTCYGRVFKLKVVEQAGCFRFRVGDQLFDSMTAAARHVIGDETRQVSGPMFWGAPKLHARP